MNIEATLKNLDSPIQTFEEDLLQRRGFVDSLCLIFESASPDESTVFALYGEWGSGKTSVKNLLKRTLATRGGRAPFPVEFNPWAFSGQDQVLEAFFSEVRKAISRGPNGNPQQSRRAGESDRGCPLDVCSGNKPSPERLLEYGKSPSPGFGEDEPRLLRLK